jgi:NADH:ubiquinone oxidoreductase subunit F (NADH-binding)
MYTATFTFAPGEYDDEFHRLDQAIAEAARAIPGYLG